MQLRNIKIISCFTIIVFLATNVTWAAPVSPVPQALKNDLKLSWNEKISVPKELGSIQSTHLGQADKPYIIYIQDAHAVIDAQNNIQALIRHFQEKYGIHVIAVEGTRGNLDPTLFRAFPDDFLKRKVLSQYLARGELSGPEMAAVFNPQKAVYYGIEDWDLYEQNYIAYLQSTQTQKQLLNKLNQIKLSFDRERSRTYSKDLNALHEQVDAFHSEKAHLFELLKYLLKIQQSALLKGIMEKGTYPHLTPLLRAVAQEGSKKSETLDVSIRRMAEKFRSKVMPKLDIDKVKDFNRYYQMYVTGAMDSGRFLSFMVKLGVEVGHTPNLTPSMKELLGQAETLSMIRGTKVFDEIQEMIVAFEAKLSSTEQQRTLLEKYRKLRLLNDLVHLEWTRDQMERYQEAPESYLSLLGDDRKEIYPALNFYKVATERDQAFLRKVMDVTKKEKAKAAIVLAGGFHSKGFEGNLKDSGSSFVAITPKINSIEGHQAYQKVMLGDLSYKKQIKSTLYDAFVRHSTASLIAEMNEPDMRKNLKLWRDEIIRTLSNEGRIQEAGQYTRYIDSLFSIYSNRFGFARGKAPKSKEEIMELVNQELEGFRQDVVKDLWSQFEIKVKDFLSGFKRLAQNKQLNTRNVNSLMNGVATRPAALTALRAMAQGNPANAVAVRIAVEGEAAIPETSQASGQTRQFIDPALLIEQLATGPPAAEPTLEEIAETFESELKKFFDEERAAYEAAEDQLGEDVTESTTPTQAEINRVQALLDAQLQRKNPELTAAERQRVIQLASQASLVAQEGAIAQSEGRSGSRPNLRALLAKAKRNRQENGDPEKTLENNAAGKAPKTPAPTKRKPPKKTKERTIPGVPKKVTKGGNVSLEGKDLNQWLFRRYQSKEYKEALSKSGIDPDKEIKATLQAAKLGKDPALILTITGVNSEGKESGFKLVVSGDEKDVIPRALAPKKKKAPPKKTAPTQKATPKAKAPAPKSPAAPAKTKKKSDSEIAQEEMRAGFQRLAEQSKERDDVKTPVGGLAYLLWKYGVLEPGQKLPSMAEILKSNNNVSVSRSKNPAFDSLPKGAVAYEAVFSLGGQKVLTLTFIINRNEERGEALTPLTSDDRVNAVFSHGIAPTFIPLENPEDGLSRAMSIFIPEGTSPREVKAAPAKKKVKKGPQKRLPKKSSPVTDPRLNPVPDEAPTGRQILNDDDVDTNIPVDVEDVNQKDPLETEPPFPPSDEKATEILPVETEGDDTPSLEKALEAIAKEVHVALTDEGALAGIKSWTVVSAKNEPAENKSEEGEIAVRVRVTKTDGTTQEVDIYLITPPGFNPNEATLPKDLQRAIAPLVQASLEREAEAAAPLSTSESEVPLAEGEGDDAPSLEEALEAIAGDVYDALRGEKAFTNIQSLRVISAENNSDDGTISVVVLVTKRDGAKQVVKSDIITLPGFNPNEKTLVNDLQATLVRFVQARIQRGEQARKQQQLADEVVGSVTRALRASSDFNAEAESVEVKGGEFLSKENTLIVLVQINYKNGKPAKRIRIKVTTPKGFAATKKFQKDLDSIVGKMQPPQKAPPIGEKRVDQGQLAKEVIDSIGRALRGRSEFTNATARSARVTGGERSEDRTKLKVKVVITYRSGGARTVFITVDTPEEFESGKAFQEALSASVAAMKRPKKAPAPQKPSSSPVTKAEDNASDIDPEMEARLLKLFEVSPETLYSDLAKDPVAVLKGMDQILRMFDQALIEGRTSGLAKFVERLYNEVLAGLLKANQQAEESSEATVKVLTFLLKRISALHAIYRTPHIGGKETSKFEKLEAAGFKGSDESGRLGDSVLEFQTAVLELGNATTKALSESRTQELRKARKALEDYLGTLSDINENGSAPGESSSGERNTAQSTMDTMRYFAGVAGMYDELLGDFPSDSDRPEAERLRQDREALSRANETMDALHGKVRPTVGAKEAETFSANYQNDRGALPQPQVKTKPDSKPVKKIPLAPKPPARKEKPDNDDPPRRPTKTNSRQANMQAALLQLARQKQAAIEKEELINTLVSKVEEADEVKGQDVQSVEYDGSRPAPDEGQSRLRFRVNYKEKGTYASVSVDVDEPQNFKVDDEDFLKQLREALEKLGGSASKRPTKAKAKPTPTPKPKKASPTNPTTKAPATKVPATKPIEMSEEEVMARAMLKEAGIELDNIEQIKIKEMYMLNNNGGAGFIQLEITPKGGVPEVHQLVLPYSDKQEIEAFFAQFPAILEKITGSPNRTPKKAKAKPTPKKASPTNSATKAPATKVPAKKNRTSPKTQVPKPAFEKRENRKTTSASQPQWKTDYANDEDLLGGTNAAGEDITLRYLVNNVLEVLAIEGDSPGLRAVVNKRIKKLASSLRDNLLSALETDATITTGNDLFAPGIAGAKPRSAIEGIVRDLDRALNQIAQATQSNSAELDEETFATLQDARRRVNALKALLANEAPLVGDTFNDFHDNLPWDRYVAGGKGSAGGGFGRVNANHHDRFPPWILQTMGNSIHLLGERLLGRDLEGMFGGSPESAFSSLRDEVRYMVIGLEMMLRYHESEEEKYFKGGDAAFGRTIAPILRALEFLLYQGAQLGSQVESTDESFLRNLKDIQPGGDAYQDIGRVISEVRKRFNIKGNSFNQDLKETPGNTVEFKMPKSEDLEDDLEFDAEEKAYNSVTSRLPSYLKPTDEERSFEELLQALYDLLDSDVEELRALNFESEKAVSWAISGLLEKLRTKMNRGGSSPFASIEDIENFEGTLEELNLFLDELYKFSASGSSFSAFYDLVRSVEQHKALRQFIDAESETLYSELAADPKSFRDRFKSIIANLSDVLGPGQQREYFLLVETIEGLSRELKNDPKASGAVRKAISYFLKVSAVIKEYLDRDEPLYVELNMVLESILDKGDVESRLNKVVANLFEKIRDKISFGDIVDMPTKKKTAKPAKVEKAKGFWGWLLGIWEWIISWFVKQAEEVEEVEEVDEVAESETPVKMLKDVKAIKITKVETSEGNLNVHLDVTFKDGALRSITASVPVSDYVDNAKLLWRYDDVESADFPQSPEAQYPNFPKSVGLELQSLLPRILVGGLSENEKRLFKNEEMDIEALKNYHKQWVRPALTSELSAPKTLEEASALLSQLRKSSSASRAVLGDETVEATFNHLQSQIESLGRSKLTKGQLALALSRIMYALEAVYLAEKMLEAYRKSGSKDEDLLQRATELFALVRGTNVSREPSKLLFYRMDLGNEHVRQVHHYVVTGSPGLFLRANSIIVDSFAEDYDPADNPIYQQSKRDSIGFFAALEMLVTALEGGRYDQKMDKKYREIENLEESLTELLTPSEEDESDEKKYGFSPNDIKRLRGFLKRVTTLRQAEVLRVIKAAGVPLADVADVKVVEEKRVLEKGSLPLTFEVLTTAGVKKTVKVLHPFDSSAVANAGTFHGYKVTNATEKTMGEIRAPEKRSIAKQIRPLLDADSKQLYAQFVSHPTEMRELIDQILRKMDEGIRAGKTKDFGKYAQALASILKGISSQANKSTPAEVTQALKFLSIRVSALSDLLAGTIMSEAQAAALSELDSAGFGGSYTSLSFSELISGLLSDVSLFVEGTTSASINSLSGSSNNSKSRLYNLYSEVNSTLHNYIWSIKELLKPGSSFKGDKAKLRGTVATMMRTVEYFFKVTRAYGILYDAALKEIEGEEDIIAPEDSFVEEVDDLKAQHAELRKFFGIKASRSELRAQKKERDPKRLFEVRQKVAALRLFSETPLTVFLRSLPDAFKRKHPEKIAILEAYQALISELGDTPTEEALFEVILITQSILDEEIRSLGQPFYWGAETENKTAVMSNFNMVQDQGKRIVEDRGKGDASLTQAVGLGSFESAIENSRNFRSRALAALFARSGDLSGETFRSQDAFEVWMNTVIAENALFIGETNTARLRQKLKAFLKNNYTNGELVSEIDSSTEQAFIASFQSLARFSNKKSASAAVSMRLLLSYKWNSRKPANKQILGSYAESLSEQKSLSVESLSTLFARSVLDFAVSLDSPLQQRYAELQSFVSQDRIANAQVIGTKLAFSNYVVNWIYGTLVKASKEERTKVFDRFLNRLREIVPEETDAPVEAASEVSPVDRSAQTGFDRFLDQVENPDQREPDLRPFGGMGDTVTEEESVGEEAAAAASRGGFIGFFASLVRRLGRTAKPPQDEADESIAAAEAREVVLPLNLIAQGEDAKRALSEGRATATKGTVKFEAGKLYVNLEAEYGISNDDYVERLKVGKKLEKKLRELGYDENDKNQRLRLSVGSSRFKKVDNAIVSKVDLIIGEGDDEVVYSLMVYMKVDDFTGENDLVIRDYGDRKDSFNTGPNTPDGIDFNLSMNALRTAARREVARDIERRNAEGADLDPDAFAGYEIQYMININQGYEPESIDDLDAGFPKGAQAKVELINNLDDGSTVYALNIYDAEDNDLTVLYYTVSSEGETPSEGALILSDEPQASYAWSAANGALILDDDYESHTFRYATPGDSPQNYRMTFYRYEEKKEEEAPEFEEKPVFALEEEKEEEGEEEPEEEEETAKETEELPFDEIPEMVAGYVPADLEEAKRLLREAQENFEEAIGDGFYLGPTPGDTLDTYIRKLDELEALSDLQRLLIGFILISMRYVSASYSIEDSDAPLGRYGHLIRSLTSRFNGTEDVDDDLNWVFPFDLKNLKAEDVDFKGWLETLTDAQRDEESGKSAASEPEAPPAPKAEPPADEPKADVEPETEPKVETDEGIVEAAIASVRRAIKSISNDEDQTKIALTEHLGQLLSLEDDDFPLSDTQKEKISLLEYAARTVVNSKENPSEVEVNETSVQTLGDYITKVDLFNDGDDVTAFDLEGTPDLDVSLASLAKTLARTNVEWGAEIEPAPAPADLGSTEGLDFDVPKDLNEARNMLKAAMDEHEKVGGDPAVGQSLAKHYSALNRKKTMSAVELKVVGFIAESMKWLNAFYSRVKEYRTTYSNHQSLEMAFSRSGGQAPFDLEDLDESKVGFDEWKLLIGYVKEQEIKEAEDESPVDPLDLSLVEDLPFKVPATLEEAKRELEQSLLIYKTAVSGKENEIANWDQGIKRLERNRAELDAVDEYTPDLAKAVAFLVETVRLLAAFYLGTIEKADEDEDLIYVLEGLVEFDHTVKLNNLPESDIDFDAWLENISTAKEKEAAAAMNLSDPDPEPEPTPTSTLADLETVAPLEPAVPASFPKFEFPTTVEGVLEQIEASIAVLETHPDFARMVQLLRVIDAQLRRAGNLSEADWNKIKYMVLSVELFRLAIEENLPIDIIARLAIESYLSELAISSDLQVISGNWRGVLDSLGSKLASALAGSKGVNSPEMNQMLLLQNTLDDLPIADDPYSPATYLSVENLKADLLSFAEIIPGGVLKQKIKRVVAALENMEGEDGATGMLSVSSVHQILNTKLDLFYRTAQLLAKVAKGEIEPGIDAISGLHTNIKEINPFLDDMESVSDDWQARLSAAEGGAATSGAGFSEALSNRFKGIDQFADKIAGSVLKNKVRAVASTLSSMISGGVSIGNESVDKLDLFYRTAQLLAQADSGEITLGKSFVDGLRTSIREIEPFNDEQEVQSSWQDALTAAENATSKAEVRVQRELEFNYPEFGVDLLVVIQGDQIQVTALNQKTKKRVRMTNAVKIDHLGALDIGPKAKAGDKVRAAKLTAAFVGEPGAVAQYPAVLFRAFLEIKGEGDNAKYQWSFNPYVHNGRSGWVKKTTLITQAAFDKAQEEVKKQEMSPRGKRRFWIVVFLILTLGAGGVILFLINRQDDLETRPPPKPQKQGKTYSPSILPPNAPFVREIRTPSLQVKPFDRSQYNSKAPDLRRWAAEEGPIPARKRATIRDYVQPALGIPDDVLREGEITLLTQGDSAIINNRVTAFIQYPGITGRVALSFDARTGQNLRWNNRPVTRAQVANLLYLSLSAARENRGRRINEISWAENTGYVLVDNREVWVMQDGKNAQVYSLVRPIKRLQRFAVPSRSEGRVSVDAVLRLANDWADEDKQVAVAKTLLRNPHLIPEYVGMIANTAFDRDAAFKNERVNPGNISYVQARLSLIEALFAAAEVAQDRKDTDNYELIINRLIAFTDPSAIADLGRFEKASLQRKEVRAALIGGLGYFDELGRGRNWVQFLTERERVDAYKLIADIGTLAGRGPSTPEFTVSRRRVNERIGLAVFIARRILTGEHTIYSVEDPKHRKYKEGAAATIQQAGTWDDKSMDALAAFLYAELGTKDDNGMKIRAIDALAAMPRTVRLAEILKRIQISARAPEYNPTGLSRTQSANTLVASQIEEVFKQWKADSSTPKKVLDYMNEEADATDPGRSGEGFVMSQSESRVVRAIMGVVGFFASLWNGVLNFIVEHSLSIIVAINAVNVLVSEGAVGMPLDIQAQYDQALTDAIVARAESRDQDEATAHASLAQRLPSWISAPLALIGAAALILLALHGYGVLLPLAAGLAAWFYQNFIVNAYNYERELVPVASDIAGGGEQAGLLLEGETLGGRPEELSFAVARTEAREAEFGRDEEGLRSFMSRFSNGVKGQRHLEQMRLALQIIKSDDDASVEAAWKKVEPLMEARLILNDLLFILSKKLYKKEDATSETTASFAQRIEAVEKAYKAVYGESARFEYLTVIRFLSSFISQVREGEFKKADATIGLLVVIANKTLTEKAKTKLVDAVKAFNEGAQALTQKATGEVSITLDGLGAYDFGVKSPSFVFREGNYRALDKQILEAYFVTAEDADRNRLSFTDSNDIVGDVEVFPVSEDGKRILKLVMKVRNDEGKLEKRTALLEASKNNKGKGTLLTLRKYNESFNEPYEFGRRGANTLDSILTNSIGIREELFKGVGLKANAKLRVERVQKTGPSDRLVFNLIAEGRYTASGEPAIVSIILQKDKLDLTRLDLSEGDVLKAVLIGKEGDGWGFVQLKEPLESEFFDSLKGAVRASTAGQTVASKAEARFLDDADILLLESESEGGRALVPPSASSFLPPISAGSVERVASTRLAIERAFVEAGIDPTEDLETVDYDVEAQINHRREALRVLSRLVAELLDNVRASGAENTENSLAVALAEIAESDYADNREIFAGRVAGALLNETGLWYGHVGPADLQKLLDGDRARELVVQDFIRVLSSEVDGLSASELKQAAEFLYEAVEALYSELANEVQGRINELVAAEEESQAEEAASSEPAAAPTPQVLGDFQTSSQVDGDPVSQSALAIFLAGLTFNRFVNQPLQQLQAEIDSEIATVSNQNLTRVQGAALDITEKVSSKD